MITRERLQQSGYGQGLLNLYKRLVPYKIKQWTGGSTTDDAGNPLDREEATITEANVITSLYRSGVVPGGTRRHALVLDIDHPSWLIPSTTPGHYHLYIDVPHGIEQSDYWVLLQLLSRLKIIETGYASASIERGFTSVRLPWVEKGYK